MVEKLLARRQEVEEQLRQARLCYFSLILKKQRLEEELKARQDAAEDQVSVAEMLRLVVETEAYNEQLGVQESSIRAHQASLTNIKSTSHKRSLRSKELAGQLHDTEAAVAALQTHLHQEKEKLKQLSEKQKSSRRKSSLLQPSTRLLLDPLLAKDVKEKLALRDALEEELGRLRYVCGRRMTSHFRPSHNNASH
nr:uncharacterized protein LOC123756447 [Procambarus clarkii]